MARTFIFFLLLLPLLASCVEKQVHIVYFGPHSGEKTYQEVEDNHHSYLYSVKATEEDARASLLYSYKHSMNGFAALLTPVEASKLSEREEVKSVFKSEPRKYSTQTTRSWEFVGLEETGLYRPMLNNHANGDMGRDLLKRAGYGKNIIVGVVDSGVWPESKSFSDEGMGPVPKSWKGICQVGDSFNSSHCNKKIIGARFYIKGFEQYYKTRPNATEDYRSPRDKDGHGTHTASTVAGRVVQNASAFGGFASGTASGGAPLARLAIYKACWAIPNQEKAEGNTCFEEDMLAAMDDAIADGVHVLSLSIGSTKPMPYTQDGIAIGAFNAIRKNIVVVCAAGNSGPTASTLSNPAPWIMTVGASSVDRAFLGHILLGNGKKIAGQTATPYKLDRMYPIVYAEDVVAPGIARNATNQCLPNSLDAEKVKGKIVLCMRGQGMRVAKGIEVKRAGGVGLILGNSPANGNELAVDAHVLTATALVSDDALELINYIKSAKKPMVKIGRSQTTLHYKPAPFMAAFTSRGPNVIDPNILKPDITAPGLNILAAWSPASSPTKLSADHRSVEYNIESGTSMACPHVAAAATLLKAIHPKWSTAAIRSALMTTAWTKNNIGKAITDPSGNISNPFQFGAGHFRPAKAADPGLVYDATYKDYLHYLCNYGIPKPDPHHDCPKKPQPTYNLNYPSIQISKLNSTIIVHRSVTNVGGPNSVYSFRSKPPLGIEIKASPSVLSFDHVGQRRNFVIKIAARDLKAARENFQDQYGFGWYYWSDGYHYVRSPVAISLA